MTECAECGAPAEESDPFDLNGVGFGPPGVECIVTFVVVRCITGEHGYWKEVGAVYLEGGNDEA